LSVAASRRPAAEDRPPAERLLVAAERLFGERSYRDTTVADICEQAGMATGSFYAHFDSKNDVFVAVIRRINVDLRAAMAAALKMAADNQRARERAAFRAYFDLMSDRPWSFRILREAEFVAPARGYARGVRVAQLAGEVDTHYDPEVIAYIYTGLGHFIGMRWAEWTAGGRVPDDIFDDLMDVLARGLPPPA
jgi:AcrR family transcriptional regulator